MTDPDRRMMIGAPLAVMATSSVATLSMAQELNPMADSLDPRVVKLFKDIEDTWTTRDFARMRGFWPKDLTAPLYLPEEVKEFITTWAGFDAYFKANTEGSRGGGVKIAPQFAMSMGPGLHMVVFALEWTTQLMTDKKPIGGWVRGIALVEEAGAEVKLKAYIEAPLAPILYMRELYEAVAASRGYKPLP